jgi:hypothetical protein
MRERLKRSLNGSPWIHIWLPGRRNSTGFPCRTRMIARRLSVTINAPTIPSSRT